MSKQDALLGFVVAFAVTVALSPATRRLAARVRAIDLPRSRGLSDSPMPRLGGLAIFAGVAVAGVIWLPWDAAIRGILGGAAVITLIGAIDDIRDLGPQWKLAGQFVAGVIPVVGGVSVSDFTLPFLGHVDLGDLGGPLTLLGIVAVMNVVNLSDGVDGLAAGVCAISGLAFTVIAFDLGQDAAAVLAAVTAGAALGFLVFNFHPASIFMGDCGSNLLGLLLACVTVQGALKTNAVIALIFPLVILAVPFLDTGFVVAKRIKYGRPVYRADAWHFHHRFANIGFSQRRTVFYLYAWTLVLAGLALALRFVPYTDDHGHFNLVWSLVMGACGLLALAASVYLILVLEILKFRRVREWQLRRSDPETSEHDIAAAVARDLETGEFETVRTPGG